MGLVELPNRYASQTNEQGGSPLGAFMGDVIYSGLQVEKQNLYALVITGALDKIRDIYLKAYETLKELEQ